MKHQKAEIYIVENAVPAQRSFFQTSYRNIVVSFYEAGFPSSLLHKSPESNLDSFEAEQFWKSKPQRIAREVSINRHMERQSRSGGPACVGSNDMMFVFRYLRHR
ncbi:MAG TPA: hypothetical protein VIK35_13300 [Verrucomicrobiae bacterium]